VVVLLDTHILLWALGAPQRLPQAVVAQIESPETTVYFSAASIWEIATKTALGKTDFHYSPEDIAKQQGIPALLNYLSVQRMVRRLPICPNITATRSIAC